MFKHMTEEEKLAALEWRILKLNPSKGMAKEEVLERTRRNFVDFYLRASDEDFFQCFFGMEAVATEASVEKDASC